MKFFLRILCGCLWLMAAATTSMAADKSPFVGYWEMTIPGGGAGWLGVEHRGDNLNASMLWGGGSVFPLKSAKIEGDKLVLTREHSVQRTENGKRVDSKVLETIHGTLDGEKIQFASTKPRANGAGEDKAQWSGKRTPAMPKAPNVAETKFGDPVQLFNGKDLTGWRLMDANSINAWSVKNGALINAAKQEEGKPHKNFGNLRTDKEFEDFNLKLDFKVDKGGNSGVYLRGIYEIQVAESYGQAPNSHGVAGVYSRITPTVNAAKPAGEWQTMEMTLVDRHVTIVLNGQKVIDNQPVLGCTGGAMWADVSKPGPIYLQGDHTSVEYRNMVLRPRVN